MSGRCASATGRGPNKRDRGSCASDIAWAAEADQAEQGFRAISADVGRKTTATPGHAWRHLAGRLPHDTRNLPRIEAAFREAIAVFERVVAESPADASWRFLADTELRLGRISRNVRKLKKPKRPFVARSKYTTNTAVSPAEREAKLSALSPSLLAENGRTAEAIDELDRAIKLNSSSLELWYSRSQLNADLGRWDKAAEDLTQAGKLTSVAERPDIWSQLALLRLAMHDEAGYRQTCATLVEKSLPNNPQGDQAHQIAWACVLLPDAGVDPAQVVRIAEAAVAANAKDPDYLICAGGGPVSRRPPRRGGQNTR